MELASSILADPARHSNNAAPEVPYSAESESGSLRHAAAFFLKSALCTVHYVPESALLSERAPNDLAAGSNIDGWPTIRSSCSKSAAETTVQDRIGQVGRRRWTNRSGNDTPASRARTDTAGCTSLRLGRIGQGRDHCPSAGLASDRPSARERGDRVEFAGRVELALRAEVETPQRIGGLGKTVDF